MNSNHNTNSEPAFGDWLSRAKHWRPGATFTGTGRFAVRLMDGKNIRLFETLEEAADFTSADPVRRFTDLATKPTLMEMLESIPDRHPND